MSVPEPELSRLRAGIDRLDAELVRLLGERAALAAALGRLKAAQGAPPFDPAREELILARVAAQVAPPLAPEAARRIWRAILDESRAIVAAAAGD